MLPLFPFYVCSVNFGAQIESATYMGHRLSLWQKRGILPNLPFSNIKEADYFIFLTTAEGFAQGAEF